MTIDVQRDTSNELLSIKQKLGLDPNRTSSDSVSALDYISTYEFIKQINPENEDKLAFVDFRLTLWNNLNAYTTRNEDHAMIKEFCVD